MHSASLTQLWTDAFDETVVLTVDGNDARLGRFLATLPLDPSLVIVDRCPRGYDSYTDRPEDNHHVLVGNRHKRVVRSARQRGLKNIVVFEDDVEFTNRDLDALAHALTWVKDHAEDWDVFYLGFAAPLLSRCSRVNEHIIRVHRPFFAHALCYSSRVFGDILAIDFRADHRPTFFRIMERIASPRGRRDPYFRQGTGSLDTWLSFSRLNRLAVDPIAAVQSSLPPGTAESWRRRTGRPYDIHQTPRELVAIALKVQRMRTLALWAASVALLVFLVLLFMAVLAASRC